MMAPLPHVSPSSTPRLIEHDATPIRPAPSPAANANCDPIRSAADSGTVIFSQQDYQIGGTYDVRFFQAYPNQYPNL